MKGIQTKYKTRDERIQVHEYALWALKKLERDHTRPDTRQSYCQLPITAQSRGKTLRKGVSTLRHCNRVQIGKWRQRDLAQGTASCDPVFLDGVIFARSLFCTATEYLLRNPWWWRHTIALQRAALMSGLFQWPPRVAPHCHHCSTSTITGYRDIMYFISRWRTQD